MPHKESSNTMVQQPIINIGYYLDLVRSRWLTVFFFSLLCASIALLIALAITPSYRATATLLIESGQRKAVSIEEVVGIDTKSAEYYLTQHELIRSNQVANKVIDALNLDQNPEFNPGLREPDPSLFSELKAKLVEFPLVKAYFPQKELVNSESEQTLDLTRRHVLKQFRAKLTVTPVRKTHLVKIHFESQDPTLAAQIANQVGYAYIENNLESKIIATEQASSWINTRLQELKYRLETSQRALLDFIEQQELIDDRGIEALTSSELTNLTVRLASATDKRIEVQSIFNALHANKNADLSTLASISAISNHPQIRDVRMAEITAEKNVSELSKRYGPKHDKMIQAKARLASIQKRGDQVVKKLIQGIESEYASVKNQEKMIKRELDSKKEEFQSLGVIKREYDALKREVDTNEQLYDLFLTRQKETSATSDFSASTARFSDHALVPEFPRKPNKKFIVIAAGVASVLLAIASIILLDTFDNTIESREELETKLDLTPLGAIPKIKDKRYKRSPIDYRFYLQGKNNIYSECIDSLRTTLMLSQLNRNQKIIAVTSSTPGEGKTTTAINLALAFSKIEKVLLIDCDLRRASVAPRFHLPESQAGLTNLLLNNELIADCTYSVDDTNLDVLTAGLRSPNPQELLSSEQFDQLMTRLEQEYDRIIIDTPPCLAVNDALIIGKRAGSLLMIMRASKTTLSQYRQATSNIGQHQIKIEGVVLNQAPTTKRKTSNEYAYYSYSYK